MKPSTKTTILTITLSGILFIIGFYSWDSFFMAAIPIVGNVKYVATNLENGFRGSLLVGLTLALIPVATVIIWKFALIKTTQKKMMTIFIIVVCIAVSVIIRREMIKHQASSLRQMTVLDYTDPANPQPKTVENGIPVSTLNFEIFALAGLVKGSAVSFFSLRQRTK